MELNHMKAVQLVEIGKPLQLNTVPLPEPGEADVLIQVKAAGICHSDEHYHTGIASVAFLPITLGHEVAGIVEKVGERVGNFKIGDRVGVHYLATCGTCTYCMMGNEQFCPSAEMIGKHRNGGYAEYIAVPASSVVELPNNIPFEYGAIMMCSTSTSFHALRKGRLKAGECVAIFGAGGLGISAVQLSFIMGALEVFAIDIRADKLAIAEKYGAIPINAAQNDPVDSLKKLTKGKGVDVALELVGLPLTMKQSVQSLGKMGRAIMVGLSDKPLEVNVFQEVLGKETEIIGCSDHLLSELPIVLEFARQGRLDFLHVVTQKIPLDAAAINDVLNCLNQFQSHVRTVIIP